MIVVVAIITILLTAFGQHRATGDNVAALIRSEGYPVESHRVHTADGYTVTVHRIPPANQTSQLLPLTFLMHGLTNSAADWLLFGRRHSLAYLLADAGHDVWLGNARGTRPSRSHRTLDADTSTAYWEFSFHEIGTYDLPAMWAHALRTSNRSRLHYVGHSQGCTTFFVALDRRPELAAQIATMHALAPAVFLGHSTAMPAAVVRASQLLQRLLTDAGVAEVSPAQVLRHLVDPRLAALCRTILQVWCVGGVMRVIDTDSPRMSGRRAADVMANTPDSVSVRQLAHFAQLIRSGRFERFDFGPAENGRRYRGQRSPPAYGLGNVTVDVHVMYGGGDYVTSAIDVRQMIERLGAAVKSSEELEDFNHFDFVYAERARSRVYRKILRNIKDIN